MEEPNAASLSAPRTLAANALIASAYLAGTNTRRVHRARKAVFGVAGGKDTVSQVWRKVKCDWDAWAWRAVLDDLIQRGLRRPEFLSRLESAIAAVWIGVPVQRCTVHKHRNLLAQGRQRPASSSGH